MQTETILHLQPKQPDRISVEIRGIPELATSLQSLSKSVDTFAARSLDQVDARVGIAESSYYFGVFCGLGLALILCLIYQFLSRFVPKS